MTSRHGDEKLGLKRKGERAQPGAALKNKDFNRLFVLPYLFHGTAFELNMPERSIM
jgi:hypothetical protein